MKKQIGNYLLVFGLVLSITSCSKQQESIKITGSDTVLPLTQVAAEEYMKELEGSITVTGGGSGVGIAALTEGTIDIAQASREIKFEERNKLESQGRELVELTIAYDALALVIHPENPVSRLTREQLEGIFTGQIQNWSEVGGEDLKIIPYSRETSSGTYEFFKEHVLQNKNYANGILSMPATGAIIQSVGQTKGAIGYVGLAYINKEVKTLEVSYDEGETFVAPTLAHAMDKSYPIVRPLLYYYLKETEGKVQPFLDFITGKEGQERVREVGYIPLY